MHVLTAMALLYNLLRFFILIYMYECFAFMCVHHMHACCPQRPEGGVESSGTGDGCEPQGAGNHTWVLWQSGQ